MPGIHFTSFPVLRTARLLLRQLLNTDENEILALRSDDSVNKYLNRRPGKSLDDARAFIHAVNESIAKKESLYWAITLQNTGELAGTICLFNVSADDLTAEIGFELLPSFQGQGIMREAVLSVIDCGLHTGGLHFIEACVHPDNQRSIRLLESLDFKGGVVESDHCIKFKLTGKGRE